MGQSLEIEAMLPIRFHMELIKIILESVKVVQWKLVQVILEFEESYVVKEACLLIAFPLYTQSNG